MASFRSALQIDPGYAKVHLSIGREYMRVGRDRQAIEAVQSAIALRPSLVEAHRLAGEIHARLGEQGEAIDAFRAACELSPEDDTLHVHMIRTYLAAGYREEALAEYKYLQDRSSPLADLLMNEIYPT